jgi:hypothetical protein
MCTEKNEASSMREQLSSLGVSFPHADDSRPACPSIDGFTSVEQDDDGGFFVEHLHHDATGVIVVMSQSRRAPFWGTYRPTALIRDGKTIWLFSHTGHQGSSGLVDVDGTLGIALCGPDIWDSDVNGVQYGPVEKLLLLSDLEESDMIYKKQVDLREALSLKIRAAYKLLRDYELTDVEKSIQKLISKRDKERIEAEKVLREEKVARKKREARERLAALQDRPRVSAITTTGSKVSYIPISEEEVEHGVWEILPRKEKFILVESYDAKTQVVDGLLELMRVEKKPGGRLWLNSLAKVELIQPKQKEAQEESVPMPIDSAYIELPDGKVQEVPIFQDISTVHKFYRLANGKIDEEFAVGMPAERENTFQILQRVKEDGKLVLHTVCERRPLGLEEE